MVIHGESKRYLLVCIVHTYIHSLDRDVALELEDQATLWIFLNFRIIKVSVLSSSNVRMILCTP